MGALDQIPSLFIPFKAQIDIKNSSNFHFFPAFVPNIDHSPVHTDAFKLLVVKTRRREFDAFNSDNILLPLHLALESFSIILSLSPDTDRRYAAVTESFKYLRCLLIR